MFLRNALAWRTAIALASWIAIAPFGAVSAQAQEYQGHAPWCANLGYLGTGWECAYYTLEQCMARASGVTNSCSVNPWYVPERTQIRRPRRDRAGYQ
jgi:Protein of unknown function (DUF3551)